MTPAALSLPALRDGIDSTDAGIARVFERVRDIPFVFAPHSDADTLLACGAGTCAPGTLGVDTRFVYVTFRFDEMPGELPAALRRAIHDGIVRGHAALSVRHPHGWLSRVESALSPELEERLLGITHRTGLPRAIVRQANAWLDTLQAR